MNTPPEGFVIWITGLPASGKTVLSRQLLSMLHEHYNIRMIPLESDQLRSVLTPQPTYSKKERDWFYGVVLFFAGLLTANGTSVLIDATANRRIYRDEGRRKICKFIEVFVKCPLEICMARDPKGIYGRAKAANTGTVPGLQEDYEEPLHADVVIESDRMSPAESATVVIQKLLSLGMIQ